MTQLCECGCGQETPIITKTDSRRGLVKGEHAKLIPGHKRPVEKPAEVTPLTTLGEITERDILNLRTVDNLDAADVFDKRIRVMEQQHKRSFVERGMILVEMETRQLWSVLVDPDTNVYYRSLERWLMVAAPYSRSDCYAAMRAIKELKDVAVEEIQQMSRANVEILAGLSTAVKRDPIVIQAAKELPERAFVEKINESFPEQHVEPKEGFRIKPDKSARKLIEDTIKMVEWAYDINGKEAAIEVLCQYFAEGTCEREDFHHLTNRLAYLSSLETL